MEVGPILGLDAEYTYTVCFASKKKFDQTKIALKLKIDGVENSVILEDRITLSSLYFYRFSFDVPALENDYEAQYSVVYSSSLVADRHRRKSWSFTVPGRTAMPRVAYASCNGDSKVHPSKLSKNDLVMWNRMREIHSSPEKAFHCLVLGGDQVYADSIWDDVAILKDLTSESKRKRRSAENRNIEQRQSISDRVSKERLDKQQLQALDKQLRDFYESVYVSGWSNVHMSHILASIPSIMMWDDHDIFDGWGSHSKKLQNSEVFSAIYNVAKEYFEMFQIRTARNRSLLSKSHFSMQLSFRNIEFIVLDNRSHRTQKRVMTSEQYSDLEKALNRDLFSGIPREVAKEKLLCFVIPVPVAHLNFARIAEKLLHLYKQGDFRHTLSDDAIDHWDHAYHHNEQKKLLDAVFAAGEKHSAKYVCIVSGDVHTAGAATITDTASKMRVTQLISSAIVHVPPSWIQLKILKITSRMRSEIEGYTLDLKNYGSYKKPVVNHRNFGVLSKAPKGGIVASLVIEGRKTLAHRTLNKRV